MVYLQTDFYKIIMKNNTEEAETLINSGVNVNFTEGSNLSTPLHLAVRNRNVPMTRLLLRKKAYVHQRERDGNSALHIISELDDDGEGVIEESAKIIEIIDLLLMYGADIECKNRLGRTPLFEACVNRNVSAIVHLLQNGANLNAKDSQKGNIASLVKNDHGMDDVLADYTIRYKCLNIRVKDANEILKVFEPSEVVQFKDRCKLELEGMRGVRVGRQTSLHDVLYKNSKEMMEYLGNSRFERMVRAVDFEVKFPSYGYIIRLNLKKAEKEYMNFLSAFLANRLTKDCARIVMGYLGYEYVNAVYVKDDPSG